MNLLQPFGRRDLPSEVLGDLAFIGVDERRPANQLPPGYASRAKNLRFRNGKAEPRKGVRICPWMKDDGRTPFTEVYGAVVFADPNQAGDWIVIAADGGVWKTRPNMAATAVPLPATVSLTRDTFSQFVPCTDNGDSVLVLLRGDEEAPLVCVDLDIGFVSVPTVDVTLTSITAGFTLTSLTSASTTATATKASHGLTTGDVVTIAGATQTEYNGTYTVTVVDNNTFTYTFAGSGTTPATGTIVCRLTTATVTRAAHGYSTSTVLVIEGATPTEFNGTYTITVTGTDTFTYEFAGSTSLSASGTLTARLAGHRDMPNSRFGVNHLNRLLLIEGRDEVGASDLLAYQDFLAMVDQFRINTGQSDRLERIQPLIGNRLLMFKTQSVLEVQNVGADLSAAVGPLYVTNKYGLAAPHGCALNGANCYWITGEPAVASLRLTELNETQDTDVRLSDSLSQTFGRINPLAIPGIVLEVWDGKLYVALPLDDASAQGDSIVSQGGRWEDGPYFDTEVVPNRANWYEKGNSDSLVYTLENGDGATLTTSGWFTPATGSGLVYGTFLSTWTGHIATRSTQQTNNAIAVYDFLNQAWCGVDEADGVYAVKAFLKTAYQGRQRLFLIGTDGVLRLMEEGFEDEVFDEDGDIVVQPIETRLVTRAYQGRDRQRSLSAAVLLRTWNPNFTIKTVRQDYNRTETIQPEVTRSRTQYDQHDATAWDATNVNDDHGNPGRFDYSVTLPAAGFYLGSGVNFDAHQTSTERVPLSDIGNWWQLEITNTTGRCEVLQCALETQDHERRSGGEVN